jgi:hypothetical protein
MQVSEQGPGFYLLGGFVLYVAGLLALCGLWWFLTRGLQDPTDKRDRQR